MKRVYCLCLIIMLSSCLNIGVLSERKQLRENARQLTEFVSESSISESMSSANFTIDIDEEQMNRIKREAGIAIVYLINSECSVCIADYISFLKTIEHMNNPSISVFGILNANHEALLVHYLDKSSIDTDRMGIVNILAKSSYPFGNNEPQKNIMVFTNGNPVKRIAFSDNSFLF